jgi:shikimate kinase
MRSGTDKREVPCDNIVLAGFMGSGKSAVGRVLAGLLGWKFVDTDTLITEQAGKDIPAIFEEEGEEGFRARECEAITSLAGETRLVVATGGGAPTNPDNLNKLRSLGPIVHLSARPETILARIGSGEHRPLLAGAPGREERLARIRALLDERAPAYARTDLKVETDERDVEGVATAILKDLDRTSPGARTGAGGT